MTTAFFLRHGPTQENREGRIQGHLPGKLLIPETERYVAAVVPLLREHNPQIVVASDLARSHETSRMLKTFLEPPPIQQAETTPLLREKAMGFYEGMLWSDVPREFSDQRGVDSYDFRPYGGESNEDVQARVRMFIQRLPQAYRNHSVCCVTHSGWLRQLVVFADREGALPDGWTHRTAIYKVRVNSQGTLVDMHAISIDSDLPDLPEEE